MDQFFITGTSQGLGRALAEIALSGGNKVCGLSRKASGKHENYTHVTADLSEVDQYGTIAESFFQLQGDPDRLILINNAGTLGDVAYAGELESNALANTFAVNLTAPVILINEFISRFRDFQGPKLIINISSGAAKNAYDGWSAYCAGKAGLEMYSRVVAEEAAKKNTGIRIWSVAPGVVDTGMQDHLRESNPEDFSNLDRFLKLKEEDRLTPPEESAEKIFRVINNPENFSGTILDVRNF